MTEQHLHIQLLNILAGLGLFFVGIKLLGRNLRALASGSFRRVAQKMSSTMWLSAFWGGFAGFVTQSGRTTALILGSLVQGRIMDVKSAIPIVIWANFGCTLIVFAAVFPINFFVLFVLGISGICMAFEKPRRYVNIVNAIFGLALMLYGLAAISHAASGFTQYMWFEDSMLLINKSFLLAFILGLGLTVLAQSHMAIILITLAMTDSGLLDFEHAVMVIYGTHVGSSIITYLTGAHFKGRAMQVVWAQINYNLVIVGIFLAIFFIEQLFGQPILVKIVRHVTDEADVGAALVAVVMNVIGPLVLMVLLRPFLRACERASPPLETEHLSHPEYLQDQMLDSPVTGLMLCEKEQLRLLKRLPEYLSAIRDSDDTAKADPVTYHQAYQEISRQILQFQSAMIAHSLSPANTEWLVNLQNRQDLLNTVEGACYELWNELNGASANPEVHQLGQQIIEALDTMVLTAIAAIEGNDQAECDMLNTMTSERGESMEQIRKRYLASAEKVSAGMRNQVLLVTNIFERATWALGRFGKLVSAAPLDEKVEG